MTTANNTFNELLNDIGQESNEEVEEEPEWMQNQSNENSSSANSEPNTQQQLKARVVNDSAIINGILNNKQNEPTSLANDGRLRYTRSQLLDLYSSKTQIPDEMIEFLSTHPPIVVSDSMSPFSLLPEEVQQVRFSFFF